MVQVITSLLSVTISLGMLLQPTGNSLNEAPLLQNTTQPANAQVVDPKQQLIRETRETIADFEKHLKITPARRLDELLTFSFNDGAIVITPLFEVQGQVLAPLTDVSGTIVYSAHKRGRVLDSPQLQVWQLDESVPALTMIHVLGVNESSYIQLSVIREVSGLSTTTTILQNVQADNEGKPALKVRLARSSRSTSGEDPPPEGDLSLQGETFYEIVQSNREIARQWLWPTLVLLKQPHMMAGVDVNGAWQVVAGWSDLADVEAKVMHGVARLDAEDVATRDDARAALVSLGDKGVIVLRRLTLEDLSPQQQTEIEQVLAVAQRMSDDVAQLIRDDPQALLDLMYLHDDKLRKQLNDRFEKLTGLPSGINLSASGSELIETVERARTLSTTRPTVSDQ